MQLQITNYLNQKLFYIFSSIALSLVLGVFSYVDASELKSSFSYQSLTKKDCSELFTKGVITKDNPVPCMRLSKVSFSYLNEFNQIKNDGELVVLDLLAPHVLKIMQELLNDKFVIYKALPIEAYNGDDLKSMNDNNSSAFNGRAIIGGDRWSIHAYGAAIDINPIQNPFVEIAEDGTAKISPIASAHYGINRLKQRPGKPMRLGMAEDALDVFANNGFFVWGGFWNYPIDYQHFQVGPRSFIKKLVALDLKDGRNLLNKQISIYKSCSKARKNEIDKAAVRSECINFVISQM